MRQMNEYNQFFRFTIKLFKYFSLTVLGFAIACYLSVILGIPAIATIMMSVFGEWLLRLTAVLICLGAIAIFAESIR